ncbi:ABC-F family ATP-binding cassette domain-containing protein [Streptomyces sp. BI20]|uniref:ABC-F family ATP-binding cassette domain-containing protein n=1 Tax=Streptomyces sp. BI20 TaxID=3403460 RepID=UPI003C78C4E8
MSTAPLFVTCSDLRFEWPDGTPALDGLDLAFGPGRTGLIGVNGSGKSTLLKLIAGRLRPAAGKVTVRGEVGYLPQDLTLDTTLRVDQALGVDRTRAALLAIEAGEATEENFALVGDDWDVEERALATLAQLGLGALDLDRTVGELSGGESVLLGLAALFLARPDVLLLDEPTNNLDLAARRRLHEAVAAWPGVMVVVSHDLTLLDSVDRIAELRDGEVRVYGGNFSDYRETIAIEQEAAERTVRNAEADVQRQKRELIEARQKLARRKAYGQKMYETKREPKIVMGARKRAAQESAGKHRTMHEDRLSDARERLEQAEDAVRVDKEIRVALPDTRVPPGRRVFTLRDLRPAHGPALPGEWEVRGPERIALIGRNGSGKTTLLRTVAGLVEPAAGEATTWVPTRYLPQRLDAAVLDDGLSVVQQVAREAPEADNNTVRARLAHFLFRGARADRPVGTLSGGERFRAALAALLLAEPAPRLLMLDEPTNNLDLSSVRRLTEALHAYEGAMVVVSHDLPFLRSIGITRWLLLDEEGLRDIAPEEVESGIDGS